MTGSRLALAPPAHLARMSSARVGFASPRHLVLGWLLLVGLSSPSRAIDLQGLAVHGRQVLTAHDLAGAGALRLADLVRLADGWDTVSVDGYTHRIASGPGVSDDWGGSGSWQLLVDGTPVPLDLLGVTNLSHLPLSPAEIDSVILERGPTAWRGGVSPGGVIRVVTRTPGRDVAAGGRFASGSETGDPGPYRYTDLRTDNVDRVGHETFARLSHRRGDRSSDEATCWARYADQALIPTDPHIVDRHREILPDRDVAHDHRALGLGLNLLTPEEKTRAGWDLRVLADAADGFLYLDVHGQEVPVRVRRLVGSSWSSLPMEGSRLNGWLVVSHLDLETRGNPRDLNVDLRRTRIESALGAGARDEPAWFTFVGGLESGRGDRRALRTRTWWGPVVGVPLGSGEAMRLDATLRLVSDGPLEGSVLLTRRWTHPAGSVGVVAGGGRGQPLRTDAPGRLRRDDFDGLAASGIPLAREGDDGRHTWATLRGSLVHALGPHAALTAGWDLSATDGIELLDPRLSSRDGGAGFDPDPVRRTGRGEVVSTGLVAARYRPSGRFLLDAVAELRVPLAGDGAVTALRHDPWPRHRGRIRVAIRPAHHLAIETHLRARGGSRWPAYDGVADDDPTVDASLPATATLDVVVRKTLAGGRLSVGLGLENVTDAPDRTHPAGVDRGRGAYVEVTAVTDPPERDIHPHRWGRPGNRARR